MSEVLRPDESIDEEEKFRLLLKQALGWNDDLIDTIVDRALSDPEEMRKWQDFLALKKPLDPS